MQVLSDTNIEDRKGPYGKPLACPNCNGMQFAIYRSNIHYGDNEEEIADCLNCNSTIYTRLLKNKYHEDKRKDFEVIGNEKLRVTVACDKCDKHYEEDKTYIQTIYEGTTYSDIDPEPIDWKCPKHPKAGTALFLQCIFSSLLIYQSLPDSLLEASSLSCRSHP
jgi:hypothetical protein